MISRGTSLLRGLLRGHGKVFICRSVRIRGRNLRLGRFVTLEDRVSLNSYAIEGVG